MILLPFLFLLCLLAIPVGIILAIVGLVQGIREGLAIRKAQKETNAELDPPLADELKT